MWYANYHLRAEAEMRQCSIMLYTLGAFVCRGSRLLVAFHRLGDAMGMSVVRPSDLG